MKRTMALLFFPASILLFCCTTGSHSDKNVDTLPPSTHNTAVYINDSLQHFLTTISLGDSVKVLPITLVKKQKSSNTLQYSDGKVTIVLTEKIIEDDQSTTNYCVLDGLTINGEKVKKFIWSGDDFGHSGMVLNTSDEGSLNAFIYKTPADEFFVFEGNNQLANSSNMRNIRAEFLVSLNKSSQTGFAFTNVMYLPSGGNFGYESGKKKTIYLDIQSGFPLSDSEYVYDVFANSINLQTNSHEQLLDSAGKRYHIKLAVPDCFNNSKYRVIESNWW